MKLDFLELICAIIHKSFMYNVYNIIVLHMIVYSINFNTTIYPPRRIFIFFSSFAAFFASFPINALLPYQWIHIHVHKCFHGPQAIHPYGCFPIGWNYFHIKCVYTCILTYMSYTCTCWVFNNFLSMLLTLISYRKPPKLDYSSSLVPVTVSIWILFAAHLNLNSRFEGLLLCPL